MGKEKDINWETEKEKKRHEKRERRQQIKETSHRPLRWDKLDNTALIFPVIAGEGMTNTYRMSIELSEEIQPSLLQEALNIILPKFNGFNVRLRMGVFWYYFEENNKPAPKVTEEELFPCRYIQQNKNNSYLFSVSYYKKCASKYNSIVDALKSIKVDSSFSHRKKIAKANGIKLYLGTAKQNSTLLKLLKEGKLKKEG